MANLIVPTEYKTIQEAIDAANPNDTISILPGVYNESAVVAKDDITINAELFGVQMQGINQSDIGITVLGSNVTVNNIVLTNYIIGIYAAGDNCKISYCICTNNANFGILMSGNDSSIISCGCDENGLFGMDVGGENNNISDNRCLNNMLGGIANSNKPLINSTIDTNILVDPRIGVSLTLTQSADNKIVKNAITAGTGIYTGAPSTLISQNVLQACELNAIQVNSKNNTVKNNFITGTANGIQISLEENIIQDNVLGSCSESGITVVSSCNNITSNIITSSTVGVRNTGSQNVTKQNEYFNNQKNIMDVHNYSMYCKKF